MEKAKSKGKQQVDHQLKKKIKIKDMYYMDQAPVKDIIKTGLAKSTIYKYLKIEQFGKIKVTQS